MEFILGAAALSTAGAVITISRVVGFKRMVRYATATDVICSGGFMILMAGTITGTLTAMIAGLMLALLLSVARWVLGLHDRYLSRFERSSDDEYDRDGNWVYNQAPYV